MKKMKKEYEEPVIEVEWVEDVITSSNELEIDPFIDRNTR